MSMSRSALPLLAPEHLCAAAGHVQTPAKIMCAYFNLPYLFQRQGPCAQLKALCRHQPKLCVHFDLPYLFQRQGPWLVLQSLLFSYWFYWSSLTGPFLSTGKGVLRYSVPKWLSIPYSMWGASGFHCLRSFPFLALHFGTLLQFLPKGLV